MAARCRKLCWRLGSCGSLDGLSWLLLSEVCGAKEDLLKLLHDRVAAKGVRFSLNHDPRIVLVVASCNDNLLWALRASVSEMALPRLLGPSRAPGITAHIPTLQ